MALVTLHAIQTATVDRHDCPLHINQIVLAQMLSFLQSKIVPRLTPFCKDLQRTDGRFDATGKFRVVVACQYDRRSEAAFRA
jgi:hypothetical protein